MKKIISAILITMVITGTVISTICFRACKKRIDITDFRHWKIVDDDWKYIIEI